MRKFLTMTAAALTVVGSLAAVAPAQAAPYRGYGGYGGYGGYHHHGHSDAGPAVAAGIVGLALGAALAGSHHRYYGDGYNGYYGNGYYGGGYNGYYGNGYYGDGYYGGYAPGYAYGYQPRVCLSTQRVFDPYLGRPVLIQRQYAC